MFRKQPSCLASGLPSPCSFVSLGGAFRRSPQEIPRMNFPSLRSARESSSSLRLFNRLILLYSFACLLAPLSFTQARVHFGGTVTDFSHNPISGVSITAQNEQTGEA